MKIRDVKTYRLDSVLAEPFAYSQAWYEHRGALLVEIVGDDGFSGWGEAFGPPLLIAPIVEFYKPLLVGTDALATELHWQTLYNRLRDHGQKGLAIAALSAVDIALWDEPVEKRICRERRANIRSQISAGSAADPGTQARIACSSGPTPMIAITRLIL